MKVGETVNYYDPATGTRVNAEVAKIVGAGPSRAKILDLDLGDKKIVNEVMHGGDEEKGDPFWLVKGEESAPDGWADAPKKEKKEKK